MTFVEKGDVTGNLTDFVPAFHSPPLRKQQGIFEFYFKSPNRRLGVLRIEDKVVGMYGCDGKVAWYFNNHAGWREFKPKPGNEYACENGYEPLPLQRQKQNARVQLKGTKKVAGQMALAVQIRSSESPWEETFYFDAQTYLLIGWKSGGRFSVERFYSDYHDVGGVKLPFKVIQRTETSETTTTLREVEINSQVDDALFERSTALGQPKKPSAVNSPVLPLHEGPTGSSGKLPEINTGQNAIYVNAKSFVDCPIAELQEIVPELRGLQTSQNQEELIALLDKIGSKTVDLFQRVPNLISQEEVVESQGSRKALRRKFSYLILSHRSRDAVTLEEYRVDVQSNQPQPDDVDTGTSASHHTDTGNPQASPLAHGFAYMWVLFYPSNRAESTFRYLGRQKINRRNTFGCGIFSKTRLCSIARRSSARGKVHSNFAPGRGVGRCIRLPNRSLADGPDVALARYSASKLDRRGSVRRNTSGRCYFVFVASARSSGHIRCEWSDISRPARLFKLSGLRGSNQAAPGSVIWSVS